MSLHKATRTLPPSAVAGDRHDVDNDDWTPPPIPAKPVLTISMDTRRRPGQRGTRVCISAGGPQRPRAKVSAQSERETSTARSLPTCPPLDSGVWSPLPTAMPTAAPNDGAQTRADQNGKRRGEQQQPRCSASSARATAAADARRKRYQPAKGDRSDTEARCDDTATADPITNNARGGEDDREPIPAPSAADDAQTGDRIDPNRSTDGASLVLSRSGVRWSRQDGLLVIEPHDRDRLMRQVISVLVGRPYGITLAEVVTLAQQVLGVRLTIYDARLFAASLPRDLIVMRRMMTPWFEPRFSVTLDTQFAVKHVVAPAVGRVLRQRDTSNGIDMRRLDMAILSSTGTSLRVHGINYAHGSTRDLLSSMSDVVGRIENIATRIVVYPAHHKRALALFEPLDKDAAAAPTQAGTTSGSQQSSHDDAQVSKAAHRKVILVTTVEQAAVACDGAVQAALETGAPIVIDCRGIIAGRHGRGPPVGMLQIGMPARGPIYQMDMVALHIAWFNDPARGRRGGSSYLFEALGVAALLADARVTKAVFDSRSTAHVFWRQASCVMTNVFDLRLAALALGARIRDGWSNNDALALLGMTIDADTNELDAMIGTDAWAWHRRPLAPRARAAAARQVTVLRRAFEKVTTGQGAPVAQDERPPEKASAC